MIQYAHHVGDRQNEDDETQKQSANSIGVTVRKIESIGRYSITNRSWFGVRDYPKVTHVLFNFLVNNDIRDLLPAPEHV